MAVNSVSSNGQVGFQTFENFGGLSPELMLAYMQSNMQSLDGQIAGILDDMNARRAQIAEFNNTIRELRRLQAQAGNSDGDSIDTSTQLDPAAAEQRQALQQAVYLAAVQDMNGLGMGGVGQGGPYGMNWGYQPGQQQARNDALRQAQAALDAFDREHAGTTLGGTLDRLGIDQESIDAVTDEHGNISVDGFKTLIDNLDSKVSELNDTTEYDSMRVGALMQKRSQLIQLTSNIMRDMNESAKAVIQNI